MTLLYILPEHPSASQTFVIKEALAVSRHGVPVVGYALARGAEIEPAASVDLLVDPPKRSRLVLCIALNGRRALQTVWRSRRNGISPRDTTRLLLALGHAAHVAPAAKDAGVTHIHAHFLGRASDVADVLASFLGCSWTATAHAGDATAPVEPMLLDHRLRAAASIACANEGVQQSLVARAGSIIKLRTTIVHCGVETADLPFAARGRRDETPRRIVTVGRLVATKGHWTVISAAEQLLDEDPGLTWTVVGDGPLRQALTADPRVGKLEPRIRFTGSLEHAQILRLVGQASAFVLPCQQGTEPDGIPVAIVEAMALGVPVITSPVGGIPELVSDGETGLLVPSQDPELLILAIKQVLYDMSGEERDRIRQAARARVERDFDLTRESEKLIRMLSPHI